MKAFIDKSLREIISNWSVV